jgi:pimeloyl-ACP methyl ester carboxylesterase
MATSTLTLSDSRILAWVDYTGPPSSASNPSTRPTIFYFHGFPGSRLEGVLLASSANSHSARLIAIDRPGMGLSTFQPNRKLLDWPRDVLELADHLQIETFYVLGASGGAPYVLACVEAITRKRLLGASVVSGIYPASLGTQEMSTGNRVLLWTAASKWIGALTGPMMDWMIGRVARDSQHPGRLKDLFVKEMNRNPERDVKCLEDEDVKEKLVEALRESFRQGGDGVAWDIRLLASEWGFELAKLRTLGFRMCLWHGRGDTNVPVAMAEKAAGLMEGVELRVLEEEAHLSVSVNRQDEILEALLLKH